MAKLGVSERYPKTPEPIDIKFGMVDYVRDITPHVINQSDRPNGGPGK